MAKLTKFNVDLTEVVACDESQTIDGIKTFTAIPELPASDPTTDNQVARKAYVDAAKYQNNITISTGAPSGGVTKNVWYKV